MLLWNSGDPQYASIRFRKVQIPPLVLWKEYCFFQSHCLADSKVMHLINESRLSVPMIKGYSAALIHVFPLPGTDLAAKSSAEL